jgi:hypothetical protein
MDNDATLINSIYYKYNTPHQNSVLKLSAAAHFMKAWAAIAEVNL